MNDLKKEQEKLQRESYSLLEERIAKLQSGQTNEFAKASNMLEYIKELIEIVDAFKKKMLQEVIGKIIQKDNDVFSQKMGVKYKNIHDVLAEPLSIYLIDNGIDEDVLNILHQSKKDFKELEEEVVKKRLKKTVKYLKNSISLGCETYALLGKETIHTVFKEMPHQVALALWQLDSNALIVTFMGQLLSLKNIDNDDVENTGNTRQAFGSEVAERLHEQIAWRFLRDAEGLKEHELKQRHRDYFNGDFDEIEQLLTPIWSEEIEKKIGQKLIDLAKDAKIIAEYTKPNDEGNFNYLKLDKDFLEKMNDTDKNITQSASMTYQPMVIEPVDWGGMYGGGFLPDNQDGERRFDLSLIKASSRKDREALKGKEIPQTVLDGINHLQKTAFCVNEKMLEVLLDYHGDINYIKKENRVDFAYYRILREILNANLSGKDKKEIYKYFKNTKFIKLVKKELSLTDKKRIDNALKSVKGIDDIEAYRLKSNIYYEIAKYKQGFDTVVNIAEKMKDFEKFYFVWRMDFRGRVYPQQTLLNPQSGDLPKSLLLFSKKQPLNKEGLKWFCVHGANCYGEVDKKPYSERVAWIEEKKEQILACARDYRAEKFWKKAGDPFKFLAWCFEYARYHEDPENFTTGIPVAIDGSNNGFQHITALLRDTQGAEKVNVLPFYNEQKELVVADFYADVADELKKMLQKKYAKFEEKKENYKEIGGLFYEEKKNDVLDVAYYLEHFSEPLEQLNSDDFSNGKYYSTVLNEALEDILKDFKFKGEALKLFEKELLKIERKVRKEVGEDDLEELKCSIIDELEKLSKRAKRNFEKGKTEEQNGVVVVSSSKDVLVISFLYKIFLDKKIINRSFVKKPVMTESYGSSTAGKAKKILEDIESSGLLGDFEENERFAVATEITKVLEKALTAVSDSPQKYKKWMKAYAKGVSKTKSEIEWITPLGLRVKQVNFETEEVMVSIGDGRKVTFKIYTDEIDDKKHNQGFSPNYIHSLDATHLMMSVLGLKVEGIGDIVTVHDSFATHANEVDMLSKILRKSFVELHKKEVLEELTAFFEEQFLVAKKEVPYVDKEGFDLDKIMESEYFFG